MLKEFLNELKINGRGKRSMQQLGSLSFAEIPPRVEYSLTKEELRDAVMPLIKWVSFRDAQ
jgi:DNA-binding HxlR family transcriptional regulator